jgi:hypothetical protein
MLSDCKNLLNKDSCENSDFAGCFVFVQTKFPVLRNHTGICLKTGCGREYSNLKERRMEKNV